MGGSNHNQNLDALKKFIRTQQEVAKKLQAAARPAIENSKLIQEAATSAVQQQEQLQEQLSQMQRAARSLSSYGPSINIPAANHSDLSRIDNSIKELTESINQSIAPLQRQIRHYFEQLPPRIQSSLQTLGEHGWFIDATMPIPMVTRFEDALSAGDIDEAENALTEHFERNLDVIETTLVKDYPHRNEIIEAAFKAHRRGEYALSIPVMLTQAEGICYDITGKMLFQKSRELKDQSPEVAESIQDITADTFERAILSPLQHELPIQYSKKAREGKHIDLNRHQILHGESVEYPTYKNSMKAISLLSYITFALTKME